jgi:hypothetical protein
MTPLSAARMSSPSTAAASAAAKEIQLPLAVRKAVVALDSKTHLQNIPDLQYRNVTAAKKTATGYEVTVSSFHTSIMGPLPGQKKPFDVVTYEAVNGKVSVKKSHAPKTPTATQLKNVYGTYQFHSLLKFGKTKPAGVSFGRAVVLEDKRMVDGSKITAHLVKGSGHLVVFEAENPRTGTSYSRPVRFDILPK